MPKCSTIEGVIVAVCQAAPAATQTNH
jgi:hypothetical protein